MKRKVFSLLALCLFAFLGLANAQSTGVVTANPDPIDLGYRPLGAWMRPFEVQLTATGAAQAITAIEADKDFFVIDAELPGTVSGTSPYEFTVTHGEANAGAINGKLVAMTESRKAYIFDIQAVAYTPIAFDVVETAQNITLPFTATVGENIYDNYLLPGDIADGKDVVYKMNITDDVLFNANVEGENGKVALYTEDFNGEPGPGATNNYTGLPVGGSTGGPFEAEIGVKTTTTGYLPAYYLYENSMSQQLYLADELTAAGATAGAINSISFSSQSTYGYLMKNVSIYLGNTTATTVTNSSPNIANMTLVYTGNHQEVVGWNEFEFSTPFQWDGTSNILVFFIMNNGSWSSAIQWDAHNPGFQASAYKYQDGTPFNPNTTTTMSTTSTLRANTLFKGVGRYSSRNLAIEDMTLTPGEYYLVASSTSDEFTVNINADILPVPEQAYNPYPADGDAEITTPTTLTWNFGNYTTAYRVLLGTTYPPTEVVVDWTNELSNAYYTGQLMNNKNYFWRVDERNSNGITEGEVWGFTTTLNKPQNLTAANEKIYEGEAVELSWNQVDDRSHRGYNVYQDGVKINTEVVTGTEYVVNGLTYNTTSGYVFNVTAVYDEGESGNSNDLMVFVSGNGTVSGKVCEVDGTTGIAGVEVNFEGVDEFLRPATYTFTTTGNGTYTGTMKKGVYTAMALKDGYQGAEYGSSITVNYNATTSNINFILQEILYPVNEVIAEEMSDTQVKVYWSQNALSQIMEDFETGDFSSFDWVNDATYPWSVTTNAPYEGTYCMMSGNAGVASSTSAIQVSVEIARDGMMSFYNKISSESNYDMGYFFLDGTQKMSASGAGAWQMKEYPITAGVHTFRWEYTKDGSVNSNDDCWYIDNISFMHEAEPLPEGTVFNFDNGSMMGWTSIDADGDGYDWEMAASQSSYFVAGTDLSGTGHNSSQDYMISGSFTNVTGAVLYPDNYLVSPQVALGGTITFYACAQDANYAAEHFGVAVSTTGNTNASDFTTIQEWTLTAKGTGAPNKAGRNGGSRVQGNWYEFTVDLSAYSGNGYVAIRHFNCHDQFVLNVDDIIIGSSKGRSFNHFNVYRATEGNEDNAELITSLTDTLFFDNEWANMEPGVYKWGVSRVYEGNRGNREGEVLINESFENVADLAEWRVYDADGDGYSWNIYGGNGNSYGHTGTNVAGSASWNNSGALTPDNYLSCPQVALGGTVSFWACASNAYYPSEHFGIAIATVDEPTSADFTTIAEWTMTAKSREALPQRDIKDIRGDRLGTWYQYTVDLSDYSGNGYIALRHFGCTDNEYLFVDDFVVTAANEPTPVDPPMPPITGGSESEIIWSNTIEHNMFVSADITVTTNSGDAVTGATVALANVNEPTYTYNATLDETGVYTWNSIRRGTYTVSVNLEGYTPVEATAEIGDNAHLSYVLNEIIAEVSGLYVSATGWAMFGNIPAPTPVDPVNPVDPVDPTGDVTVILTAGDVWGDGSGYQMLLDADANAYGTTIPTTGALSTNCSGNDAIYGEFEYKIPTNADGNCSTQNIVMNNSVTITIPAGTYDWCVTNPTPGDRIWIASAQGNVGGRQNDYVFEAGKTYEFTASLQGSNDAVNVTITDSKGVVANTVAPMPNNDAKNINNVVKVNNGYVVLPANTRSIEYYNVKLDGELEGTTTHPFFQHNVEGLVEGETYTTSVQAVYTTGESEWVDFSWVYSACDNYEGLKEDPTAEWQGDNVVLNWLLPEGGDNPPTPVETLTWDFESNLSGWTTIDANGDGYTWFDNNTIANYTDYYASLMPLNWCHGGSNAALGASYINGVGALSPDDYLVSPQVTISTGATFSFWVAAVDPSYPADHFGVAVSTASNTNPSDFTIVQEWTLTAKADANTRRMSNSPASRDGKGIRLGNWYNYSVDLSTYAGQQVYIAFRHFNCSDQYIMIIDDAELSGNGGGDDPNPPVPPTSDTFDFEDGLQGWTTYDADGDGNNWAHSTGEGITSHSGTGVATSESYINYVGALTPDNWLISPQRALGGTMTFWAAGQDPSYASEHFAVYVSTTGTSVSDFTQVMSETVATGSMTQYTVDLSAYSGNGYVAIRHFNCTDMFRLNVDDIAFATGKGNRSFDYDFEGGLQGWTTIDADGNGLNWYHSSQSTSQSGYDYTGYGHNGSNGFAISQSFIDFDGAYQADNYLVSPQRYALQNGSNITFFADNANDSYPDHFGVYVATAANPTASDFTAVWEGNAKTAGNKAAVRHNANRFNNWRQHTVDLSAYAGQEVWIAFRHNDYDMYEIWIDDVTINAEGGTTPVDPVDPVNPTSLVWDFEADFAAQEILEWTTINANNDEYTWYIRPTGLESLGHNNSQGFVTSASYMGAAITPDDYLVSPQVTLGGVFSFWACAQDASYPAEHFGVAVSTTGNTNAADFTIVDEWTLTAKGNGGYTNDTRSGNRVLGNWYQYTVDLSSYSGQGYIAIRHFNCNDMFRINVDDIEYTVAGDNPVPQPGANVRGVEIFRDGEWIAEVLAPAQTYTDVNPGEVGEYEIRVVYNGQMEDYSHYTMSCPQIAVVPDHNCLAPENLTGSYEYFNEGNFGALINWTYSGEVNSEELSYDNGAAYDGNAAGLGGGAFQWASMFPAGSFQGGTISKISTPDAKAMTGTLSIYAGGSNAPGTLVATKDITFAGTQEYVDFTFDEPVVADPTQNLWVVFNNVSGTDYPAAITDDVTGDPNGRWLGVEGYGWLDMASAGLPGYSWMIHVFIGDDVNFNVYRNGELIANVPYSGESMTYFDQVAIGNYQYQVTAVTGDCESDFALTPDMSQNYVEISVTNVNEINDTRIYPNPTTGNVTIEAAGMNHITVVNTLGQVLYDTNVNGDQMTMNLGQFKAGVYMIRITTESGVSVSRVTVTK